MRDPLADHLITPDTAALLLIDYQPAQLAAVRSMDHAQAVRATGGRKLIICALWTEICMANRPATR